MRLIDVNVLVEFVGTRTSAWIYKPDLFWAIEQQPTVDAVEVIHAFWTGSRINPLFDEYEEHCSHCGSWSVEYGKPYCPNCGAKMNGGEKT